MAGGDNSFERQMIDFYGSAENVWCILEKYLDPECPEKNAGIAQIAFDIALKDNGISKKMAEAEKAKLQIELYDQLEKDRQEKNNAA